MSLKIIKAGIMDTIQDLGRYGYQHIGINPTGAMDKYAMQVSNILVGNDPGEAVIELHFPASVFLFTRPAIIALSGADFSPCVNGEPVPMLHPLMVAKNDLLHFNKPVHGARTYLARNGGMMIEKWLDSYSTNIKARAGGFKGRNLNKDDEIRFNNNFHFQNKDNFKSLPWKADINWEQESGIEDSNKIFVIKGNEWDRLAEGSKENFISTSFEITPQSDRMGYRLNNDPLQVTTNEELVSAAVSFGTIQLLPNGQLIILAADHQTTGGYPRIGHVICAHHSRLAQFKAGDKILFQIIEVKKAEELFIKQQQHLLQLGNACTFRLHEYFNL